MSDVPGIDRWIEGEPPAMDDTEARLQEQESEQRYAHAIDAAERWLRQHASRYVKGKVEWWRVSALVARIEPSHGGRDTEVETLRSFAASDGMAWTLKAIAHAVDRIGEATDEGE